MAYFLEPENEPYDPQEPLPTTLGFTADHRSYVETLEYKRAIKPIPERLIHKTLEIGGPRPMPDFFCLYKDDLYVSSRFRLVLDAFAADAIEYIEMDLRIPSYKNPADAYYFVNVLGRNQLIDWDISSKRRRIMTYFLERPSSSWVMRHPTANDPAIWHEIDRNEGATKYAGDGYRVFVTDALGDALQAAFPGQCRLTAIKERD